MRVTQDRMDLMDTVTVDGVQEKDPLTIQLRDFTQKRRAPRVRVLQHQQHRPDFISYEQYRTVGYWWFVMDINDVVDPWEVPVHEQLIVPDPSDYYDWFVEQQENA